MPNQSAGSIRIARPARDLAASVAFYTELIGLQELGGFDDHAGYHGRFLGPSDGRWHLELTSSPEPVTAAPTLEDLLVLFLAEDEIAAIAGRCAAAGVPPRRLANPYWERVRAIGFADPDGYLVVLRPALSGTASP